MLEIGVLKNFDSGTYKAGIQLAGSLTTYFDDVSVAKNIASGAMVVGNYVIVAIPGGNPKDACVIATWPQGTLAHKERHGYLGDDELPILYLIAQRAIPMINKHWGDLGGLTEGHSGGSLTLGIRFGVLNSGPANGNFGRVWLSQPSYHAYPSYGHTLGEYISIRQTPAQEMWLGWFESTTPGTNQNHYAFRIVNDNLYAYAGKNDANKQNSTSLLTWSSQADIFLSMRDSSDAIKFYVNHSLAYSVTNSANRPSAVNLYLIFYLKTTEAVNKQCFLMPFTLFTAHSH